VLDVLRLIPVPGAVLTLCAKDQEHHRLRTTNEMKKHTIEVIAHRGVNRPGLENTLEGFAAAVQDGASAIECDVRLTRDHQPVVIHTSFGSDDVELILGVKESLTQLSWSELSDLRLRGSGFRVPHLADVLRFAESKDVRCYLEPKGKEKGLIDEIVRTVESRGRVGKDVILTFYRRGDFLESAKRLNPRMVTNAIVVSPFGAWRSIRYRGDQGVDSLTLVARCESLQVA
jgi:glycerophosphoryl diester phosphodiesterase